MKKDNWTIKIIIMAFTISLIFSSLSETIIPKVNTLISIIILIIFIIIGIIFDMIGVAVTTCDIKPFHSMNSKKIDYSKTAISLIKNGAKVSSFCNDVIGDICGIISGGTGIVIAANISNKLNTNAILTNLIITSIIAALTIGGKALGKTKALNNNTKIVKTFSKIIHFFTKKLSK